MNFDKIKLTLPLTSANTSTYQGISTREKRAVRQDACKEGKRNSTDN